MGPRKRRIDAGRQAARSAEAQIEQGRVTAIGGRQGRLTRELFQVEGVAPEQRASSGDRYSASTPGLSRVTKSPDGREDEENTLLS